MFEWKFRLNPRWGKSPHLNQIFPFVTFIFHGFSFNGTTFNSMEKFGSHKQNSNNNIQNEKETTRLL